jgi:proton glutamate symport protein
MLKTEKPIRLRAFRGHGLMAGSLAALCLGFSVGLAAHAAGPGAWMPLRSILAGLGSAWVNALRVVALPLAVANLMAALVKERDGRTSGRIAGTALVLFCVSLLLASALALGVIPAVLHGIHVDRETVQALSRTAAGEVGKLGGRPAPETSFGDFLTAIVPGNLIQSLLHDEVLPLLVFGVAFALAIRRSRPENGEVVIRLISGTAEALYVMVRWILYFTPIGVFAIAVNYTAGAGIKLAGILWQFMLAECGVMLLYLALLYILTAVAGRISMARFARAVLPAQLVAAASRSSLASLPVLLECGEERLRLNPTVARVALPLSVSVFKANRPISSLTRLLFVAYFWGIPLEPGRIAIFVATNLLMSFSTLGVPATAHLASLPAYLAAGLPLEGVVLLEVVEPITDILKTVLNVTGDLSVAAIVDRLLERSRRSAQEPELSAAKVA